MKVLVKDFNFYDLFGFGPCKPIQNDRLLEDY